MSEGFIGVRLGSRTPETRRFGPVILSLVSIGDRDTGGGDVVAAMSGPRLTYQEAPREQIHSRGLTSQYRYVVRRLEDLVRELGAARTPVGSRILDYGCASQPYRHLFGPGIEYVGADLHGNPNADVLLLDNGSVPEPDSSFDVLLSTQVLEHVEDPDHYLAEAYRLLRPGGALVLTTHGLMYYHPDPVDYWRWTHEGLIKLVRSAGFEVEDAKGALGLSSAALQLLQDAAASRVPRVARPLFVAFMQQLVALADRRYSDETRLQNSLVLGLRGVRPNQGSAGRG